MYPSEEYEKKSGFGKIFIELDQLGESYLYGPSAGLNVRLAGDAKLAPCELLRLRLSSWDDRNGHEVLVDLSVEPGDVERLLRGLFPCGVRSVALLPEKLTIAKEGLGVLELPPLEKGNFSRTCTSIYTPSIWY